MPCASATMPFAFRKNGLCMLECMNIRTAQLNNWNVRLATYPLKQTFFYIICNYLLITIAEFQLNSNEEHSHETYNFTYRPPPLTFVYIIYKFFLKMIYYILWLPWITLIPRDTRRDANWLPEKRMIIYAGIKTNFCLVVQKSNSTHIMYI